VILLYFLLIALFGYLLVRATDHLVSELRVLSQMTKLSAFGLTAFLVAFATSLPELVVGIASAIEGRPSLSLGNVLGSNISNISLVVGGAAVLGGSIRVVGDFLRRELLLVFLAGSLPLLLLVDNSLSRIDALILLVVYLWYSMTILRGKTEHLASHQDALGPFWHRILLKLNQKRTRKHLVWLVFWLFILMLSGDLLVRTSTNLAELLGIPVILMGIVFLAIGTTLPEFAFEVEAVRNHQAAMVYGNLLGSVVANSTVILGITALIHPIVLDGGFHPYLLATVAFVVVFGVFWMLASTKHQLERWEGVLLLLIYVLFVFFEFFKISGFSLSRFFSNIVTLL